LADTAVNLAMAQIWEGSKQESGNPGREIWASQPGAIRKYKNDGSFYKGYKLYSDDKMIVTSNEQQEMITADSADIIGSRVGVTGEASLARFVDLNEPVIRPDSAADADNLA
jgi:hypothetical protein